MGLFDVHTHLTHPDLLSQVDAVVQRAMAAGVTTIVTNGLNPRDNRAVLKLAERFEIVRPALGLYPVDAVLQDMRAAGEQYPGSEETWSTGAAVDWVRDHAEQALAIGEIGLDGYWVKQPFWEAQDEAFRQLVRIAMDADKPVIIHTRKRERRALELLDELGARRVDWHCFTGRVKLAREIVERGHCLSIPANARRSQSFTKMLETLPREQLLLETDAPYLGPERDVMNEPANVAGTVAYAAELWNCSPEQAQAQLEENFERLFGVAP